MWAAEMAAVGDLLLDEEEAGLELLLLPPVEVETAAAEMALRRVGRTADWAAMLDRSVERTGSSDERNTGGAVMMALKMG